MKKFILASGSPRRKEILLREGYAFEIMKSDKEDAFDKNCPAEKFSVRCALSKARDVYSRVPQTSVVLGADTIVALGGDGTINEVFNGIDVDKVKLGLIPCGSGNDFVASANIPTDTEAAVDLILDGEAKPTDFMVCGGVRGLNIIGTSIVRGHSQKMQKKQDFKGKIAIRVFARHLAYQIRFLQVLHNKRQLGRA